MKKKILITLGVLIIFVVLGLGAAAYVGSHLVGQERDGTYPEYYVRDTAAFHKSLIACEHISLNAVFLNQSKTSLRSECIQNLAIATKNTQLCSKVKPMLFNSGFNEETCQAYILNPTLNDQISPQSAEIEHLYQLMGYDVGALVKASGVEYAEQYWDSVKKAGPDAEALKLIESYDLSANIDYGEFLRTRIEMKCKAGVIKSSSIMCQKP
jgi:hypothetical protein